MHTSDSQFSGPTTLMSTIYIRMLESRLEAGARISPTSYWIPAAKKYSIVPKCRHVGSHVVLVLGDLTTKYPFHLDSLQSPPRGQPHTVQFVLYTRKSFHI